MLGNIGCASLVGIEGFFVLMAQQMVSLFLMNRRPTQTLADKKSADLADFYPSCPSGRKTIVQSLFAKRMILSFGRVGRRKSQRQSAYVCGSSSFRSFR